MRRMFLKTQTGRYEEATNGTILMEAITRLIMLDLQDEAAELGAMLLDKIGYLPPQQVEDDAESLRGAVHADSSRSAVGGNSQTRLVDLPSGSYKLQCSEHGEYIGGILEGVPQTCPTCGRHPAVLPGPEDRGRAYTGE